ncbi:uncharacterized protein P174DRAFT_35188 [Aspergillus novofumigatus IBT 16806]|uniref:Uncharacterized protein n=1 Tax=Aspergillus novofumigatus (strain IBT 16806) TaxID=1392255 RepID=A0A2I1CMZ1_ASPN1|nr:uncharacterized protein P174DRAFT_35188 [Aspergillus novofumigatus IBT 16806]PKX98986.1 hypothetical protein P174DRAFT_35188 [Aspergillus novofumigatus IBT 16806]
MFQIRHVLIKYSAPKGYVKVELDHRHKIPAHHDLLRSPISSWILWLWSAVYGTSVMTTQSLDLPQLNVVMPVSGMNYGVMGNGGVPAVIIVVVPRSLACIMAILLLGNSPPARAAARFCAQNY